MEPDKQIEVLQKQLIENSALLSRMAFASELGMTYAGKRDMYQALGYKKLLSYEDYYRQYKREDIAKVVVDKPVNGCWATKPGVKDETGEDESPFEKAWDDLVKRLKVFSVMNRLDKLLGLGDYAVLLLGLDDSTEFNQPVSGTPNLKYLQPYSCNAATVTKFDSDKNSERFGMPLLYQIQVNHQSSTFERNQTLTTMTQLVHYSRVIHVVEDPLESLIYGTPRMEAVFNRLQDIQKVLGSNPEMFWRNASPGRVAKLDKDVVLGATEKAELKDQFDEYDNNLRRWLRVRGIDIQELSTSIASPKDSLRAQIDIIAAVTGIPKRILMGAEAGELASSQDEKAWNSLLYNRMLNFCEPAILRPFITLLIDYKILPPPVGEFVIEWPKASGIGEKEKAEIGSTKMEAMSKYLSAPGATDILPLEIFFRDVLNFEEDTVKEILLKIDEAGGLEAMDFKQAQQNGKEPSTEGG